MSSADAIDVPDTRADRTDARPSGDGAAGDGPPLDRDQRVRAEMIGELIRESARLRVSPFMIVAVLATVFLGQAPLWPTIMLTVGAAAFLVTGDRLRAAWENAGARVDNAEAWALRYAGLSAVVGSVWGAGLAGYAASADFEYQALLALLGFGSLVAAVVHRALYPPSYFAFALPTALPMIVLLALAGDETQLATAAAGLVSLAVLFAWMRALNRRFRETMALRFENTDLIERLEAAHRAADSARVQAEAGDRTKSEFLATISHELRTPMNGIIGMTGLLLGTRLSAQQQSYAEIVRESADALMNLINDILDFTKMEAGHVDLDAAPFEIAQTVESAVGLMAARAQARGLQIVSHIAPDVPDIMTADAGRLRQVLLNLLANAVKFTEEGHVSVRVDLSPERRGMVRIAVSDTGIGIPADVLPRLFRPFSQAGGIARRFGGTGLGLAISRRLVEAMGGEITVDSTPGVGTTFTVDLPLRDGRTLRRLESLKSTTVVVAGPEGPTRDMTMEQIRDWGAAVQAARDRAGALAALARIVPGAGRRRVLLVDWRIEDGAAALARAVATDPALADCRLVLTVPVGVVEAIAEEDDALFDARLLQPLRRQSLHRALSGAPVAQDEGRARPAPETPGVRLRVLVVDDVPVNQKLAMTIVETAGHDGFAAGSGREALQALRALPYDLVLMDVEMPEMDGLAATRAIRQLPGAVGSIPIIAMTAHPADQYIARCLDAGMNGYLSKPLEADALLKILRDRSSVAANARRATDGPVSRLVDEHGIEIARALAADLLSEFDRWTGELENGGPEVVQGVAHTVRGVALNLGLDGLADLASGVLSGTEDAGVAGRRLREVLVATRDELSGEVDRIGKGTG
ncbi:MAG: ATP-binding protein [Pseudomonadota bacterium]|nr:ATP-binding protein [Pseudomonadota bacterium]